MPNRLKKIFVQKSFVSYTEFESRIDWIEVILCLKMSISAALTLYGHKVNFEIGYIYMNLWLALRCFVHHEGSLLIL